MDFHNIWTKIMIFDGFSQYLDENHDFEWNFTLFGSKSLFSMYFHQIWIKIMIFIDFHNIMTKIMMFAGVHHIFTKIMIFV